MQKQCTLVALSSRFAACLSVNSQEPQCSNALKIQQETLCNLALLELFALSSGKRVLKIGYY